MTSTLAPLLRLDRKTVLVTLAALLVAGGLLRGGLGFYQDKTAEIEAKEATLFAQEKSSRQLAALKKEMSLLEREATMAEAFLFHGAGVDTITSTMQIRLQALITEAGLEPESIRPLGGAGNDGMINTISIKTRLNGSLENFAAFLAALYRNEHFFLVEDCTLKPDKMKGLKIFLDLKAFYRTGDSPAPATTSTPRRPRP
jgi:Tfp pilus assembly protein PilO